MLAWGHCQQKIKPISKLLLYYGNKNVMMSRKSFHNMCSDGILINNSAIVLYGNVFYLIMTLVIYLIVQNKITNAETTSDLPSSLNVVDLP